MRVTKQGGGWIDFDPRELLGVGSCTLIDHTYPTGGCLVLMYPTGEVHHYPVAPEAPDEALAALTAPLSAPPPPPAPPPGKQFRA